MLGGCKEWIPCVNTMNPGPEKHPIVIYNPAHSPARQASDIAHKLAHIILEHDPAKMVLSQDGTIVMRSFNEKQEEEANWLAWSLLLPRCAWW